MQLKKIDVHHALLFLIVIVGAWLRLRNLGADSIWADESASWFQSKGTLGELLSMTAEDNYPPLHNLILYAALNISGSDTEWVLRFPSALIGIANIVAVYWLGTLLGGRIAGIFAATILALSSIHIYYSQEARMYSLLALAATLYAASALSFMKSPTNARAALIAACGVALVYSHPFGTLNWFAIGFAVSAHILLTSDFPRRGLVRWIAANAAIGIIFLPWAIILQKRARILAGWWFSRYPTVGYVLTLSERLSGGALASAGLLASFAAALRANLRASAILIIWIIGPLAMAVAMSLVSTHILGRAIHVVIFRYLVGALPGLAALAGLGLAYLVTREAWLGRAAAAALLAAVVVGNLTNPPAPRDDWRTVAKYLDSHLQESDCVIVYPLYQINPIRYYLRKPFCSDLSQNPEQFNAQSVPADRLFAVYAISAANAQRAEQMQAAIGAFGREVERIDLPNPGVPDEADVRNIAIVQYKRN